MRCFGSVESNEIALKPASRTWPAPDSVQTTVSTRDPARNLHDGLRTQVEARVAFIASRKEPDYIETPARKFSRVEITSGLLHDSREEDEESAANRPVERRLHGRSQYEFSDS